MDTIANIIPIAPEGLEYIEYIFKCLIILLSFKTVLEGVFNLLSSAIKLR